MNFKKYRSRFLLVFATLTLLFSSVLLTSCQGKKIKNTVFSVDDLAGKTIGVQLGTTGDTLVSDYETDGSGTTVSRYNKGSDAIQALKQGKADAVVIDEQPALAFVKANPDLTILEEEFANEDYAICVAKGNSLTAKLNEAIEVLMADGTIQKLIDDYVGDNATFSGYKSPDGISRTNGTLVMATNAYFKPYEYYEGGSIIGIDADIAQAIADYLGMNLKIEDMDAIAVTYKPGLLGSLLVGLEFAKTVAAVYNKPLIGVNHLIGHIYANNIEDNLEFPLLALVVSGGHTELSIMHNNYEFELLGTTLDDAIGESFDKVARVLGFPYPGGPSIEKAALLGKNTYNLTKPVNDDTYNFSYSGLKSQVLNIINNAKMKNIEINKNDLSCSFQTIAVDEIVRKVELALKKTDINRLALAGGVSANKYLHNELQKICDKYNVKLYNPRMIYCTDNAAMIGAAAYPLFLKKDFKDLTLDANSSADLIS